MGKRVLFVGNDQETEGVVARAFADVGFALSAAPDGVSGLFQFGLLQPDLIILDAGVVGFLQRLRSLSPVPVIALVDDEERAKIESLDLGADQVVIKPPSVSELQARARALLRSVRSSRPLPAAVCDVCER